MDLNTISNYQSIISRTRLLEGQDTFNTRKLNKIVNSFFMKNSTIIEILDKPVSLDIIKSLDDSSLIKLHSLCKSNLHLNNLRNKNRFDYEPVVAQEIVSRQKT